jgi:hypothetical protein
VAEIAGFLKEVVLPLLKPGERLLHDFTVTSEPDDGTFHRDQPERNYSLHHEVLLAVIAFLEESEPPVGFW